MRKKTVLALSFSLMMACAASLRAAALYYVDGKIGQDSHYGTKYSPWKTIQKAANTVLAGDIVLVAAGVYPERITVDRSGSEGALIQFSAAGTVDCQGFTVKGDYIRVRGFKVTGSVLTWNAEGCGIWVEGRFCSLEDNFAYDGQRGGINLRPQSANCVVRNNGFYRNGLAGMEINGTNHLVENNEIWGSIGVPAQGPPNSAAMNGIWFFGSGHIFRGNVIHDIKNDGLDNHDFSTHVNAFQTWADAYHQAASNIIIEKNFIYLPGYEGPGDSCYGFMFRDCRDITIRNNIVIAHGGTNTGAGNVDHIKILNNTFIGSLSYLRSNWPVGIFLQNCPNSTVKNNIIYNQAHWAIYLEGTTYAGLDIDNNCTYNSDGSIPLGTPSPHDLWGVDPLFANPAFDDYHLKSGSPCRDAGATLPDVPDDYDNTSRPWGAAFDIGVFEYHNDSTHSISFQLQNRAIQKGKKTRPELKSDQISPAKNPFYY